MDNFQRFLVTFAILVFQNFLSIHSAGVHLTPQEFCYKGPSCGPESRFWTQNADCYNGTRQSPIDLQLRPDHPLRHTADGVYSFLPLQSLNSDHFFIQNNGHTVNVDFIPSTVTRFCTSYPVTGSYKKEPSYKFGNAHFHWGKTDSEGSEHTVNGREYSMEMHLVHYNSKYTSIQKAVLSGDPEALIVVAVFLQASDKNPSNPALSPIIDNLSGVKNKTAFWEKVDEPLDLSKLIPYGSRIYTYSGSLTTPSCNEQVHWYVFEKPIPISTSDSQAFRQISDEEGDPMVHNHRPTQPLNSRKVYLLAH